MGIYFYWITLSLCVILIINLSLKLYFLKNKYLFLNHRFHDEIDRAERAEKACLRAGLSLCDSCDRWHTRLGLQLCGSREDKKNDT